MPDKKTVLKLTLKYSQTQQKIAKLLETVASSPNKTLSFSLEINRL